MTGKKKTKPSWRVWSRRCGMRLLLGLCCLLPLQDLQAAAKLAPWMLADWHSPAPHFADLGLNPRALGAALGPRLLLLPHAPRDITLPGHSGLRAFKQARFISAIANVDMPAATLRRRLQDVSDYKNLFPLLTQSEALHLDGRQVVARYRVELPLPAMGSFTVDFRVKQVVEPDGSISALLLDGQAESLVAMLGGATDELADQPVLARWEVLPLTRGQSLLVFTYWDRVELKSFFARKIMEAYPELKVVQAYMVSLSAAEAIRRRFVQAPPVQPGQAPMGFVSLAPLQKLLSRFSGYGQVAVIEPETLPAPGVQPAPLRYVSVINRLHMSAAQARDFSTRYQRLPAVLKEMQLHALHERGRDVDLDLTLRIAVLLIRFSIDLNLQTFWLSPMRLEFKRQAGELAQVWGAAEWQDVAGSQDSLMLVSAAHEVGPEAPLLVRMAHSLVDRLPYIDQLGSLIVQMVAMERMRPWLEQQALPQAAARTP